MKPPCHYKIQTLCPIAHIEVLSCLKTQLSLNPVSVSPSLGGVFIVPLIPWRSAVFSWQWASSNRKQFSSCLQSAPSFPSPGVFSLGCNLFTHKLPGDLGKQISQLHCLWLCNVQLWCFCLGPTVHGLFWGIMGFVTSSGEAEKGRELGECIVISPKARESAAEARTWWAVWLFGFVKGILRLI